MSGGGEITTQLGITHLADETQAAATRYLTRTDNADLLPILGLGDPAPTVVPGNCPICGNRLPSHGVCRRREACREAARAAGCSA